MKRTSFSCLLRSFFVLWLFVFTFSACKKSEGPEPELSREQKEGLLKDSVYLYTKFVYLWEDALPNSFNTRQYDTGEDVLDALTQFKKDAGGQPVDRYSFLDRTGAVSEEIQEGLAGDFGFDLRYTAEDDLRVKLVQPNSPASAEGLERSWRIISINGNTNIGQKALSSNNFRALLEALAGSSITLKLRKPDNAEVTVTLPRKQYALNPIPFSKVYTTGNGKKVGYFVFNSFISIENKNIPTATKVKIDAVMADFQTAGVREMIVDLRYNGGGSVQTAEYLTDLLAPADANGKVMYTYNMNKNLAADKDFKAAFAPVNISKKGTLNLNNIYFITTGGTASASELLINSLKPYLPVWVIGEQYTYGKPVGFFPIPIFDTELYAVSFETLNSKGEGRYYSGIPANRSERDDLLEPFGSLAEDCLAQALYHAEYGSFGTRTIAGVSSIERTSSARASVLLNTALDRKGNKDMFKFDVPVKQLP
ncbi:peptidase S41-like protein [Arcticibacter pallidicorallinus]|uniref:Peptidase S41-like protein n=1 Tax=Arcticibacter pallidicorallinus TaxID=1259464 RepID=A0A2T0U625_9SPHI|nr:S41 family peptidase [Arcticibacter pallidicorallinus]PRY53354.1 peptidase S41-like protein [Arcticibacter pallidicorallinus]